MNEIRNKIVSHKYFVGIVILFLFQIFFRFYHLIQWASFDWDQTNHAWAAIRILTAHKYPLVGMMAKGNSGMFIGPLYYYLVAIFYFLTNLNPIASPILAACTGLVCFYVVYNVSKRIFDEHVAFYSCFVYTFSIYVIHYERSQELTNFLAPLSFLAFYFLYRVITGQPRYLIHLALSVGLLFHIHFTAIFFPIIIFFSLPLFPKKKETWKYFGISLLIFFIFLIPPMVYYVQIHDPNATGKYALYFSEYYHGLHFTRILQLTHDAFIEFYAILQTPYRFIGDAVWIFVPIFSIVYFRKSPSKNSLKLLYLIGLWIAIPWLVFATYRGELTDYYFSVQLYIAAMMFGYLTNRIIENKYILIRILICVFWLYFAYANVVEFSQYQIGSLVRNTSNVEKAVQESKPIQFTEGDPESYIYYYFMVTQKHIAPYRM